jgi:hypothetical protein
MGIYDHAFVQIDMFASELASRMEKLIPNMRSTRHTLCSSIPTSSKTRTHGAGFGFKPGSATNRGGQPRVVASHRSSSTPKRTDIMVGVAK